MSGYISLHRSVMKNFLWSDKEPLSKFEAWVYILMKTNWCDGEFELETKTIIVKRGSFVTSIDKLCHAFRWGNTKTRNYLKKLESKSMIVLKTTNKYTLVEVVKYNTFQDNDFEKDKQTNNQKTNKKQTRNKPETNEQQQYNKENKKNKEIIDASALAVYENYVSIGSNQTGHKRTQALKNIASMLRKGKTKEDLILYAENYRDTDPSSGYVISCSNFYGQNKGYEEYETLGKTINTSSNYPEQMEVIRELFDDEEFDEFMTMNRYPRDYDQRLRKHKVGQNV